jgi:hypothetical protein
MKKLFVGWRGAKTQAWYPVGCLEFDGNSYQFYYINLVREAIEQGFNRIFSFSDLGKRYQSDYLFPFFVNRLMSRSRPDYQRYINSLNIAPEEDDPITVLSRSGGLKATDEYEVFPCSIVEGDTYTTHFFLRGLRHRSLDAQARTESLQQGDSLVLVPEPDNKVDPQALKLMTADNFHLGYCPRYLSADIYPLFQQYPELVRVTLDRVNHPPIPIQYRLLCRLSAKCDPDFQPFAGEDYQKLDRAIVAKFAS